MDTIGLRSGSALRREVIVAAVLLALVSPPLLGLTGCGASPSDDTRGTLPPTTTSTSSPDTTSTSTTPAPSPAASSGTAVTEPLADTETRLPDGLVQAMGFIHQIGDINQKNYIWINYAGLLTDRSITWEEFRSYWSLDAASDTVYLRDVPWWIVREGDMVIRIDEQYLP